MTGGQAAARPVDRSNEPGLEGVGTATAPGGGISLPPAPVTESAIRATLDAVRADHPNTVGARVTTADGGTARVFLARRWQRLDAAGYVGWRRRAGIEAGAEVLWDLTPED